MPGHLPVIGCQQDAAVIIEGGGGSVWSWFCPCLPGAFRDNTVLSEVVWYNGEPGGAVLINLGIVWFWHHLTSWGP